MDDVVSKWYWGRVFAEDYTIIFMDTYLMEHSIRSFMLARQNKIIQSSNNLIEVLTDKFIEDEQLKTAYPSRLTIRSVEENNPFEITLTSQEVIDKRDLLEDVNPLIKWLIKSVVSRPAYFGNLAEATVTIAGEKIKGTAIYEMMYFRRK